MKFRQIDSDDVKIVDFCGTDETPYLMARLSYSGYDTPDVDKMRTFFVNLLKNGHMVPFEHCSITFHITAPIFVFRQLFRYRTAIISEKSLRYCEATPEFYAPWLNDKQREIYELSVVQSFNAYKELVDKDSPNSIAKEQARGLLPLCTFSECYFTMNLRNLFHLLDQRMDTHAQLETRLIAKYMDKVAGIAFPVIFSARDIIKDNKQ